MLKMSSCCILLLSSLVANLLLPVAGFVFQSRAPVISRSQVIAFSTEDSETFDPKEIFPVAEYEEFSLLPHRPLGMTVEESLADSRFVLVTKVVDGGNANQAGIQVGDVLVGLTGLFGDVTNVIGLEVEKVKGMVASRPEDEALQIKVARGTDAYDEHEKAVIELCANESTDKEIEQCVVDYLSTDYNDLEAQAKDDEECDVDDPDADCLVDNLLDMWAEDLPPAAPVSTEPLPSEEPAAQTVKPWSSRSSPSGTYVRDPTTGEMKNIG